MERDVLLPIALVASFAATAGCWVHIWRSADQRFFKIAGALVAAMPFVGPIFYWFTRLPPRLPEDAQAPQLPRGTQVREEMTRQMFKGWRKHLNRLYGVGQAKNQKRKVGRGDT
jgi:hypothetical protein